ncbi:hypothetical protein [Terrihabitans sp. B22-R8]|uniref:hypothetical protein n=1 Tax=Terrihabitans sp. B22-R8 TaxID=3425128 RepID=UPI00403C7549
MSNRPPPIPPENRPPVPGAGSDAAPKDTSIREDHAASKNPEERGANANIKQNTTNQGHQQDR